MISYIQDGSIICEQSLLGVSLPADRETGKQTDENETKFWHHRKLSWDAELGSIFQKELKSWRKIWNRSSVAWTQPTFLGAEKSWSSMTTLVHKLAFTSIWPLATRLILDLEIFSSLSALGQSRKPGAELSWLVAHSDLFDYKREELTFCY